LSPGPPGTRDLVTLNLKFPVGKEGLIEKLSKYIKEFLIIEVGQILLYLCIVLEYHEGQLTALFRILF
jgi:hypothetical protein